MPGAIWRGWRFDSLGDDWQQGRIVVLAGTGGNGGGGITAARHLANRGARVELCMAMPNKPSEVVAWQRKIFQSTSAKEVEFRSLECKYQLDRMNSASPSVATPLMPKKV